MKIQWTVFPQFSRDFLCLPSLIKIQHVCQMSETPWLSIASTPNRKCILSIQLRSSITFNQYNFSSLSIDTLPCQSVTTSHAHTLRASFDEKCSHFHVYSRFFRHRLESSLRNLLNLIFSLSIFDVRSRFYLPFNSFVICPSINNINDT